jgi:streptogrisin C
MSNKGILSVLATLTCLGLLSHLVLVEASQAQADGAGTRGGGDSSPGEKFIGSACVQDTVHAEDMAARYEISVEEACRRLDFQVEKIPLMRALRHDHASVFGGAWVDHDAGGVLHVAVTERSAEVETLVEKLTPAGGHVGVALVEHSEVYLNDVAAKLRDELEPWRDGEGAAWAGADVDVVGVAVDPEYNQVVLSVRPGSLERATRVAVERYGHVVSIVKAITVPGDGACTRTDCDPPLRGGIRVERRNSSSGCTLGFMAHNHASNQSHYAITAGHCAGVSEVWQHRNDDIGGVPGGGSLDVGRTDAARIHVGGYSSFSPGNGYYF